MQRRTFLATGLTSLAWTAMHGLSAASNARTRFVISVSGPVDGPIAKGWGKLTAELQQRGFPTTFVSVGDPLSSFTANEMRAAQIVAALKDVREPVVILGVSNQGGFLPLVAAARPRAPARLHKCDNPAARKGVHRDLQQRVRRRSRKYPGQAHQGRAAGHGRIPRAPRRPAYDASPVASAARPHPRLAIRSVYAKLL